MKFIIIILFVLPGFLSAQTERKQLNAVKISSDIKIDANLNDEEWQSAPIAQDFVMFQPDNGVPIPKSYRTKVKVVYSDEAIYIGAMMYDPNPDSILTQLTQRDDYDQNNDWFGFFINPYNDGLSDFNFFVTAAGVQADSKTTVNGDDFSLNSVWESAVAITDSGWICEVRVPYIALRFPETPVTDWGFNMMRNIRRKREIYSWSYLNVNSGYRLEYQTGLLQNMSNIDPPVRLSLMPYISAYVDDAAGNKSYDFNAGLDLKYGINESFTLDMTLIPDFGQVVYDQQFLNLSPFENRFDENRQFFTEGTELFTVGDLFYSRRIGGAPKNITGQDLSSKDSAVVSEAVEIRQEYTRILNATKISGRTNSNLGIGFLNAVTDNNYTIQIDSLNNEVSILTEPLTNYNILVLDQRFKRKSSLGFINTNVLRNGNARDANVSALLGSFFSEDGNYFMDAAVKMSNIFEERETTTGYSANVVLGKGSGKWRWAIEESILSDDYNIDDLGFLARNNQHLHFFELGYNVLTPKGKFNRYSYSVTSNLEYLYKPYLYEEWTVRLNSFYLLRNFFAYGFNINANPISSYDYFEPRRFGKKFRIPPKLGGSAFISTDYRKKLAWDINLFYEHTFDLNRNYVNLNIEPRIRLGDHFFAIPQLMLDYIQNDYGWTGVSSDSIFFGKRDRFSFTTAIEGQYVFNPKSFLNLSLRYLYSYVDYSESFLLQNEGQLNNISFRNTEDLSFNTLNIDLKYSWWFAPGSELVLLYRNVVASSGNTISLNYLENLGKVLTSPMQNNLSVKLTYFLDYNSLRKRFRK